MHPVLAKRVTLSNSKLTKQRQENFIGWLYNCGEEDTPIAMELITSYIQEQSSRFHWGFNTCCQYIGHIVLMYPLETRQELKADPTYSSFIKEGKRTNVRPFKYFHYDIKSALQYLVDLGDNSQLSLVDLTAKLAWLISMTGFLRPSDLARVDINKSTFTTSNIIHLVIVGPKEKRQGQPIWRSVAIHPHDNALLCPEELYKEYCKRVASAACMIPHPHLPNTQLNALVRATNNPSMALCLQNAFPNMCTRLWLM